MYNKHHLMPLCPLLSLFVILLLLFIWLLARFFFAAGDDWEK